MAQTAKFSTFRVFTANEHFHPKYQKEVTQHFTPTSDQTSQDEATIAAHLESLSSTIMQAQIGSNLSHAQVLRAFCSPDFSWNNSVGSHPCIPNCTNLADHIRNISEYKATHPPKEISGVNYTTSFSQDGKVAIVTFALQGYIGPGAAWRNRESVTSLFWRKRAGDGSWECWKRTQILGGAVEFP